jgi:hypothetical protein
MRIEVHRLKLLPLEFLPMQPLDVNKNKKNLLPFGASEYCRQVALRDVGRQRHSVRAAGVWTFCQPKERQSQRD